VDVFVYGLLANREVLFLLTRSVIDPVDAWLHDYEEARAPTGEPTIRKNPGCRVRGLLIREPSELFLRRLDWYHGPNYHRETLRVSSERGTAQALVYSLALERKVPEGAIDNLRLSSARRSARSRQRNP